MPRLSMRAAMLLVVLIAAPVLWRSPAYAQAIQADVVSSCGSLTYSAGMVNHQTIDTSGRNCGASQATGTVASGAADSGNPVKVAGKYNVTLPTFADGQRGDLQIGTRGSLHVELWRSDTATPFDVASSGVDGVSNTFTGLKVYTYGASFNGSTWDRQAKPNTTSRIVSSAATTNATSAKASAGNVHLVCGTNTTASLKYLKLYDKASAPTVGTDTPRMTIALSPSNASTCREFPNGGAYFATGIAFALTGAAADADTTALAAGDVVGLDLDYN